MELGAVAIMLMLVTKAPLVREVKQPTPAAAGLAKTMQEPTTKHAAVLPKILHVGSIKSAAMKLA